MMWMKKKAHRHNLHVSMKVKSNTADGCDEYCVGPGGWGCVGPGGICNVSYVATVDVKDQSHTFAVCVTKHVHVCTYAYVMGIGQMHVRNCTVFGSSTSGQIYFVPERKRTLLHTVRGYIRDSNQYQVMSISYSCALRRIYNTKAPHEHISKRMLYTFYVTLLCQKPQLHKK